MAYPSTPVLDPFDRANEDPATGWISVNNNWEVNTNLAQPNAANTLGYYATIGSVGPDSESYFTLTTKAGNGTTNAALARMAGVGSAATLDGYAFQVTVASGTDTMVIQRIDNGVASTLGSSISQEMSNGNVMGIQCIGDQIMGWRGASGTFTLLGTRTDSTYTAAGNIGMSGSSTSARHNDFGGGAYRGAHGKVGAKPLYSKLRGLVA